MHSCTNMLIYRMYHHVLSDRRGCSVSCLRSSSLIGPLVSSTSISPSLFVDTRVGPSDSGPGPCSSSSSTVYFIATGWRQNRNSILTRRHRTLRLPPLTALSSQEGSPGDGSGGSIGQISWALVSHVSRWSSPLLSWVDKYRDILQRVSVTLAMLAIMRAGMFIPLPGVDLAHLQAQSLDTEGESNGSDSCMPACLIVHWPWIQWKG